jgi:predicted dehydrogenase
MPDSCRARSAIIGTGAIAHAHAQALLDLGERAALVAVVDIDPDRAAAFAARFAPAGRPAPAVYTDAAQLFAQERLDLVHVCTPPGTHAPLAIEAMRNGTAVLIEKPTALSLHEMDEIVTVSDETGVPALTVFQHRFGHAAQKLMALVQEGVLGRPLVATCETLWYRTPEYFDLPWRGRWDAEGGGPTMGHGIHQFDLLLAVLGPWRRVSAFAARQALPTDTEDVSMALAEFESGALATVVNSIVSPRETSRLRFDFENASVEVEHLYGYTDADWRFTPAPGHEELAGRWGAPSAGAPSSHRDQIESILDALAVGSAPAVDAHEARRTLEFVAATYASAFRGAIIHAGGIDEKDPFARSMGGGMVPWSPVKEVRR